MFDIDNVRYEKYKQFSIDGKVYTLIDFLSKLRTEAGITKKEISQVVKGNDYWYSQIEMKKEKRTKYIRRVDLANIISVIKFGAKTKIDLKLFFDNSLNYIDTVFKTSSAVSTDLKVKEDWDNFLSYNNVDKDLEDTLNLISQSIRKTFYSCNCAQQFAITALLNEIILNLNNRPIFSLHYMALPFATLLSGLEKNNVNNLEIKKINDELNNLLLHYSSIVSEDNFNLLLQKLSFNKSESNSAKAFLENSPDNIDENSLPD